MAGVLVGGLLGIGPAHARPPLPPLPLSQLGPTSPEISRAQEQIEEGDFEEAVRTVQTGLDAPDVTDDQLVELYRLLGMASLYLGDEERAREAYEKLLQARPDFELPRSAPPKIRSIYARIKEDIKSRRVRPVTLDVDPLPDAEPQQPVVATARIEDLALGAKAKLFYRRAGDQSFSSVDFIRERGNKERFVATVPAYEVPAEASAYEVEYYFEVADAAQRRLAGRGDSFHPLVFQVSPKAGTASASGESRPWYKSPWFWAGVGAVAVGGTAAAVLSTSKEERGQVPITIRVNPSTP
ncbi:tetratricopeptide repeat protein [Myxococcaceae bacterium GXIMD 01537]